MKYFLLSISIFLFSVQLQAQITTNLIGHWRFDETSGTTAGDSSGPTVHNGSQVGNWPGDNSEWTPGQISGALDYSVTSGGSNRINISPSPELELTGSSFSVSTWVRVNSLGGIQSIMFHGQHTVQWANWGLGIGGTAENVTLDANSYVFYMRSSAGSGVQKFVSSINPAVTNEWTHLVATYDDTNGSEALRLYVNGVLEDTSLGSLNMFNSGTNLQFGGDARLDGSAPRSGLDGLMDDAGIWTRQLSQTEITQIYNAGLAGLDFTTVPEPSTYALLTLAGFAGLVFFRRKQAVKI